LGFIEQAKREACNEPRSACDNGGYDAAYNGWRDTYAQWGMTFFALTSVGLGVATLALLQRTIAETRLNTRVNFKSGFRQVNETRRIGEAQVRAYVQPQLATVEVANSVDGLRLAMDVRNVGQTPARGVTARLSVWIVNSPIKPSHAASILADIRHNDSLGGERGAESMTIGADSAVALFEGIDPDTPGFTDDIESVIDGDSLIVNGGRIHYRDVFGKPHVTTFFQTVAFREGEWEAGYYQVGNDAD
jgi:hypothetical protein